MTLSVLPLALEVSDNMDLGELIVGAGTLALAGITGLLAWKTSASVAMAEVSAEAARESADAARDSVEAMAMPYIIATPEKGSPAIYSCREQRRAGCDAGAVPVEISDRGRAS